MASIETDESGNVKHYRIGYTQGTFDMFHVGHLNIIERAAQRCDALFVGVNSDALVEKYKKKRPVIPQDERQEIVGAISCVSSSLVVDTLDKLEVHKIVPFDVVFIGDDWKGNARWRQTEIDLASVGADVVYLPHTAGVSSTGLREKLGSRIDD